MFAGDTQTTGRPTVVDQLQQRNHRLFYKLRQAEPFLLLSQFDNDLLWAHAEDQMLQAFVLRTLCIQQLFKQYVPLCGRKRKNRTRPLSENLQFLDDSQLFEMFRCITAVPAPITMGQRKSVSTFPDSQCIYSDTDFLAELLNCYFCPRQIHIYLNNINIIIF